MADLSFKNQLRLMREQLGMEQAFSAQQAQAQMEFQERMSNTAHRREVYDLKAAGLNPVLSASGGSGASSPSGAAGDTASIAGMIPQMLALAQSATKAATTSARAAGKAADAASESTGTPPNGQFITPLVNPNSGLQNIFEGNDNKKPLNYWEKTDNPAIQAIHQNLGDTKLNLGFWNPTVDQVLNIVDAVEDEYHFAENAFNSGKNMVNYFGKLNKETQERHRAKQSKMTQKRDLNEFLYLMSGR